MSMNRVTLIGRLGKDPEIRTTQSGSNVASLSVATSEKWKDRHSGETQEKTEWHRIVIWNENLVEIARKWAKKGTLALIEGALQTRKWSDNTGADRYSTEIVLGQYKSTFQILADGVPSNQGARGGDPGPSGQETRSAASNSRPRGQTSASWDAPAGGGQLDDEIPFGPCWQ